MMEDARAKALLKRKQGGIGGGRFFASIINQDQLSQVAVTGGMLAWLTVVFFEYHSLMNRDRGIELRIRIHPSRL